MAKKWPEMVVQRSFIKEHSFPYRLYNLNSKIYGFMHKILGNAWKKSFEQNKNNGLRISHLKFQITHSVFITLSTIGLCVVVAIVAFFGKVIYYKVLTKKPLELV